MLVTVLKTFHKSRGDRACLVAAKMWNELLLQVRQASSLAVFKHCLNNMHFHSLALNPV